jgi:small subunit ribosomal protein S1
LTAERVEEQTADESAATSTDMTAQAADTNEGEPTTEQASTADGPPTEAAADDGGAAGATDADAPAQASAGVDESAGGSAAPAAGDAVPAGDAAPDDDPATTDEGVAAAADSATTVAAAATETADDATPVAGSGTTDPASAAPAGAVAETAEAGGAADTAAPDEAAPTTGDPAETAGQLSTAAPSPEAAIGASGARPLGDAEEIGAKADAAIDRMADQSADAATAEQQTAATDGAQAATDDQGANAPPAEEPSPRKQRPDGPEPTTMEELLNEQEGEIRSLKHGDVVEGTVVRIDKDEILVDIGAKSEGVVSNRELYGRNAETQPKLNIGDTVLVYVLQPESPEGHAVLSLRRAGLERKWRSMQEQLDAGTIIEAPVIDHNKGGLIVDCGIRGFVPISQIVDFPRRPQNEQPRDAAQEIAEKLQPYVGRKLRLKILEVNRKANRLILSEKVALYEERREKRDELFSSLQVGQKVTGTVRSIAPFGVFIDLGGIDGLVHKSELSWNKVNNPEAGYKIGEEVEAEVIDINHERGRISLSIRRLQPDPWHSSVADMKVGDVIDGAVTKIVNFGAFVRVRDGLEGLIHISELSHQRVVHPGDVVHEGQKLNLKVISLDSERHRLGLSLKQAEEEPAPRPERERRPRQDRGPNYDPSQAVQEPEGGIDNTLAAAFAQVRQQMEETEAARRTPDEDEAQAGEAAAQATEGDAAAEPAEAVLGAPEETTPGDLTVAPGEAPALEVGPSDQSVPGASETGAEPGEPTEAEAPADAEAAPADAEPTEAEAPADAEPTEAEAPADAEAAPADAEPTEAEAPADAEAAPADAEPTEAEAPADAEGDTHESAKTAAPSRASRSKRRADESAEESGAPVADTSGEPAEGSPEAAPAAGGDTEEPAATGGDTEEATA